MNSLKKTFILLALATGTITTTGVYAQTKTSDADLAAMRKTIKELTAADKVIAARLKKFDTLTLPFLAGSNGCASMKAMHKT